MHDLVDRISLEEFSCLDYGRGHCVFLATWATINGGSPGCRCMLVAEIAFLCIACRYECSLFVSVYVHSVCVFVCVRACVRVYVPAYMRGGVCVRLFVRSFMHVCGNCLYNVVYLFSKKIFCKAHIKFLVQKTKSCNYKVYLL